MMMFSIAARVGKGRNMYLPHPELKGVHSQTGGFSWRGGLKLSRKMFYTPTYRTAEEAASVLAGMRYMIGREGGKPFPSGELEKLNGLVSFQDALALLHSRPLTRGKSKFPGVSVHRATGKWIVQLQTRYKNYYLGLYEKEEDAAHAFVCGLMYMRMLSGTSRKDWKL
eukprot:jgi/Botrbrau1/11317/Bobra.0038s0078.2